MEAKQDMPESSRVVIPLGKPIEELDGQESEELLNRVASALAGAPVGEIREQDYYDVIPYLVEEAPTVYMLTRADHYGDGSSSVVAALTRKQAEELHAALKAALEVWAPKF